MNKTEKKQKPKGIMNTNFVKLCGIYLKSRQQLSVLYIQCCNYMYF